MAYELAARRRLVVAATAAEHVHATAEVSLFFLLDLLLDDLSSATSATGSGTSGSWGGTAELGELLGTGGDDLVDVLAFQFRDDLVETLGVDLNADRREDLGHIVSRWSGVTTEDSEQVSSNVTHLRPGKQASEFSSSQHHPETASTAGHDDQAPRQRASASMADRVHPVTQGSSV